MKLPAAAGLEKALPAVLLAAAAAGFWRPVDDLDVWWHLASGEAVWRLGAAPSVDLFSWTVRGRPWIDFEWLYEWLLYGLHARWGLAGVAALKTALCAGLLGAVWLRLRGFSPSWLWRAAGVLVVWAGGAGLWRDRPEFVSVLGLSLLLWTFEAVERGARRWPLWLWPVLFCLWANSHGLFWVGLGVAAVCAAAAAWGKVLTLRAAAAWWALCALGTVVNPYGTRLHKMVLEMSLAATTRAPTYDMAAPTLWGVPVFWAGAVLLALSFLARWSERRGVDWKAASVGAAFFCLGARHLRGAPVFLAVAFPYALANLEGGRLLERVSSWVRPRRTWLLAAVLCGLAARGASAWREARSGVDVERSFYARAACDFIAQESLQGPFYNDYPFGSYWVWRFKGEPGDFIDGRMGSVEGTAELFGEITAAQRTPLLWNAFLDRYGVSAALLRYPFDSSADLPPLFSSYFPRGRWALVYWDDLNLIFLRRESKNAGVIRRHEFKHVEPDATGTFLRGLLARSPELRPALLADIQRGLALHPASRRARRLLDLALEGVKSP